MKHVVDGINVSVHRLDGSRLPEWPNPYENRNRNFEGSFGSRHVVAPPGTALGIVVEFLPRFKLYSATGIQIAIVLGDKSLWLDRNANGQVYWLDASQTNIRQEHRFSRLAVWKEDKGLEPDCCLAMEMPRPDPQFAFPSADWMTKNVCDANTGSVTVWIRRMKVGDKDYDLPVGETRDPTDPPTSHRTINTGWPKVIQGQWCKGLLNTPNGRDYVFEFVNMPSYAVDQSLPEASPEFGHDDILRYELRDAITDIVEEPPKTPHDPWGNEDYREEAGTADFNSTAKKRAYTDRRRSRLPEPPNKKQQMTDNQDDDEELPVTQAPELKEEVTSERDSSRTQKTTPSADQRVVRDTTAELYGITPERNPRPVDVRQNDNTQAEVSQERLPVAEGPPHATRLEKPEDFELSLDEARIERDSRIRDAEIKYQRDVAQIRARQRRHGRRSQA